MSKQARAGTWVEICSVVLPAADRAPQVPADTGAVPLRLWLKGFLLRSAEEGEVVEVRTITGREVTGTLRSISPSYTHTFGSLLPEILPIGQELRSLLEEEYD